MNLTTKSSNCDMQTNKKEITIIDKENAIKTKNQTSVNPCPT